MIDNIISGVIYRKGESALDGLSREKIRPRITSSLKGRAPASRIILLAKEVAHYGALTRRLETDVPKNRVRMEVVWLGGTFRYSSQGFRS